jgi:Flp pilus assembly secretin CpaC
MLRRALRQLAVLLLTLFLSSPQLPAQQQPSTQQTEPPAVRPNPKLAKKLVEQGNKAESAGNLDDALAAYGQAARYAPDDPSIIAHLALLRSDVVRQHVEAAERAALAGHMDAATDEMATALRIDPGNAIVLERMAQMKNMEEEPLEKPDPHSSDVPKLQPKPGKQSIDLRGNTRTAYEQLALNFGVKASFDPDLPSRNVRLRLDSQDFDIASSILGIETGTFLVPVKPSLFLVAQDTPEKRKQYSPEGEKTFVLGSLASNEEMTELLRILRDLTGTTHATLDTHSHTITVRDTTDKLDLIGKIIHQVERARGEVLLDIELLEVDTNKARQLGLSLPTSTQFTPLSISDLNSLKSSTDLTNLLTNLSQLLTAKGIASTASLFPFGGGLSTFLLTLPGTAANFSDTLSLVRSGRQVLLRAQDGKPATFFVGDRYPITLSLLSESTGGAGNQGGITSVAALAGTTFPETTFNVGKNPAALAANTFTGGTLPDLAIANQSDNTITILQNQDNGNFVQPTTSPISLAAGELSPVALGTGIFRTDTTKFTNAQPPDLVVVNSGSGNISILLGNVDATTGLANGTFTEATGSPIKVGNDPSAVLVTDLNDDGNLDLVVTNRGDNSVSLFKGNGDGTFTQFTGSPFLLTNTTSISEAGPVALVSGSFRNNSTGPNGSVQEVDFAVVNTASNNVSILATSVDTNLNVTLSELSGSPIAVGNTPVAIATADFNGDGVPDLAVVNQVDNTVSILLGSNNLDGTFLAATGSPIPTATTPAGIVAARFASGATPDLAVTNEGVGTLGVYIGQGDGTFAPRIELNVPPTPSAIITSVLSSSGLPDVALVAQGSSTTQGVATVVLDSSVFASNNGTGGSAQVPYPASEYVDIGVKIKATPALHPNHDVTLQMEFEIRSLSGSNINGIPIISNRTLTQTVRVREDQPSLIGGLTDREETRTITGLPGLATLPVVGYAFGTRSKSLADTELLIVITPRRLRFPDHTAPAIYAGRGADRSPATRGPVSTEAPEAPRERQPVVQPQPGAQPGTEPQPQPTPTPQPNPPQSNPPQPTPPPQPNPNP